MATNPGRASSQVTCCRASSVSSSSSLIAPQSVDRERRINQLLLCVQQQQQFDYLGTSRHTHAHTHTHTHIDVQDRKTEGNAFISLEKKRKVALRTHTPTYIEQYYSSGQPVVDFAGSGERA